MKQYFEVWLFVIAGALLWTAGCHKTAGPEMSARQKEIARGEKIFAEKQCSKCHVDAAGLAKAEMPGPELTSVFLAVDTVFIKAHLQFIELSEMPALDLTPEEIGALTQYVASMHVKAKADPQLKHPDGVCPVCGAPLKIADAAAQGLQSHYEGKMYSFECADCKRMFERDAGWYVEKGYLATQ